jgi:hypothetical protein
MRFGGVGHEALRKSSALAEAIKAPIIHKMEKLESDEAHKASDKKSYLYHLVFHLFLAFFLH